MSDGLNDAQFDFLRELSNELTGNIYDNSKKYLFENRLPSLVRKFQYDSMTALVQDLQSKRRSLPPQLRDEFVDLVTTHETLFFRDLSPFKVLKQVIIPELLQAGKWPVQIYSSACSTGQEAVSIAITLHQSLPAQFSTQFNITATDISASSLNQAKEASYSQLEIQRGMPAKLMMDYFKQQGDRWHFREDLKQHISYRLENLLKPTIRMNRFQIIFCRNMTIYLTKTDVRKIYEYLHSILNPGGYFIVGSSENLIDHKDIFNYHRSEHGIYYTKA